MRSSSILALRNNLGVRIVVAIVLIVTIVLLASGTVSWVVSKRSLEAQGRAQQAVRVHRLHDAIQRGLARAFDDVSFQALFDSQPAQVKALALAHLESRHVIRIDNPLMTDAFRAMPQKYFFALKGVR